MTSSGPASSSDALPQSFTLQIIDSEGEVQGDWICVLDPDTPHTYTDTHTTTIRDVIYIQ